MAQLISNLPIGAKIKFGKYQVETETPEPIIWQVVAKNHAGYPANSVTLVTEKIIDLRAFDGLESTNPNTDRKTYGNNRYSQSNIRQWLNKSTYPWYVSNHSYDAPPTDANTRNYNTGYDDKAGFLSNFTPDESAVILSTTLTVAKNTVTDGGGSETIVDKVFLPSVTELGFSNENSTAEGSIFEFFTDSSNRIAYITQQCFNNTKYSSKPNTNTSTQFYSRTPQVSTAYSVRCGSSSSAAHFGYLGIRPAMNVLNNILVSNNVDADGCYVQTFNQDPVISGEDIDLGTKISSFSIDYTIDDADEENTLTVVEKINGTVIRTINNAVRNQEYSIPIDISKLTVGSHNVVITVIDNKGDSSTRTYTFNIETLRYTITLNKPITIEDGSFIEGKNLIVKVNNIELPIIHSDDEKITYKGSINETIDLEIESIGTQVLDKMYYVVN